jgi:hypothetical protein
MGAVFDDRHAEPVAQGDHGVELADAAAHAADSDRGCGPGYDDRSALSKDPR